MHVHASQAAFSVPMVQFLEQSGHFHSAHNLIWSDFPAQEIGAKTALSLMATHDLFRYRVPVPHVLVQSLQGLQRDHLDSVFGRRFAMTDKSATPLLAEEALISLLEESVTAANVVNSGIGDIGVC